MAERFSLTLELNLQAPRNVQQVVSQLQRQLSNVTVGVNVNGARAATRDINNLNVATQNTSRSTDNMARSFAVVTRRFAAFSVATRAVSLFTNKLSASIDEAIKFQREMNKISQVTGKSTRELKSLEQTITRLSVSLGASSTELTSVARILSQAGFAASDLDAALTTLAKTTLAPTFENITKSAEGAVAIFNQFGEGSEALEAQFGAINAVAGKFAVESGDLIGAVRRMGGVFKSAGGDLNELIALFTAVRSTTRESAESIATGLRTIFTRIQRPSTIAFLEQLGIQLTDIEGRFVGPFEAVKALSSALENLPEGDLRFVRIGEELGGFRQIGKVIPLIRQFTVAEEARQVALAGAGSLDEDAAKAQEALAIQITKVKEEYLALVRSFADTTTFKTLLKATLGLATAFAKILESLKPLLPAITAFATIKVSSGIAGLFAGRGAGRLLGFNRGGSVPGVGNRDTVPAMLQPGEFVIRKSAVQAFGAENLSDINRFAAGGPAFISRRDLGQRTDKKKLSGRQLTSLAKRSKSKDHAGIPPQAIGGMRGILFEKAIADFLGINISDRFPDLNGVQARALLGYRNHGGRLIQGAELKYALTDRTKRSYRKSYASKGRGRNIPMVYGYAAGGAVGTDTVPALLTPGEFVVNKKSAESFGYDGLNKINKMATGGMVGAQRFQNGGNVARTASASAIGLGTLALTGSMSGLVDESTEAGKQFAFVSQGLITFGVQMGAMRAIFQGFGQDTQEAGADLKEAGNDVKTAMNQAATNTEKQSKAQDTELPRRTSQQVALAKADRRIDKAVGERTFLEQKTASNRKFAIPNIKKDIAIFQEQAAIDAEGKNLAIAKFDTASSAELDAIKAEEKAIEKVRQVKDRQAQTAVSAQGALPAKTIRIQQEAVADAEEKAAQATEKREQSKKEVGKAFEARQVAIKKSTKSTEQLNDKRDELREVYAKQAKLEAARVGAGVKVDRAIAAKSEIATPISQAPRTTRSRGRVLSFFERGLTKINTRLQSVNSGLQKFSSTLSKVSQGAIALAAVTQQVAGFLAARAGRAADTAAEDLDLKGAISNSQEQAFFNLLTGTAGGAASGALAGAQLGSFAGPVGTAVGGLAGAGIGGAIGFFSADDGTEEQDRRVSEVFTGRLGNVNKALTEFAKNGGQIASLTNGTIAQIRQAETAAKELSKFKDRKKALKEAEALESQLGGVVGANVKNLAELNQVTKNMSESGRQAAESAFKVAEAQRALVKVNLDAIKVTSAFSRAATATDNLVRGFETGSTSLEAAFNTFQTASTTFGDSPEGRKALDTLEEASRNFFESQGITDTTLAQGVDRSFGNARSVNNFRALLQEGFAEINELAADTGVGRTQAKDRILDAAARAGGGVRELIGPEIEKLFGDATTGAFDLNKINEELLKFAANLNQPVEIISKALIEHSKLINQLTEKRRESERRYVRAQQDSIETQIEASKIIAEFGGGSFTTGQELRARGEQFNIAAADAGVRGLRTGTSGDILRASQEITQAFQGLQVAATQQGLSGAGGLDVDQDRRKELSSLSDALITYTKQRIGLLRTELDIVRRKNELERSSIESLLNGDVEGFFRQQGAAAGAGALRSGDASLLRALGASDVAGGLAGLSDQLDPSDARGRLQFEKASSTVLGNFGLSGRASQVFTGTTPEEENIKSQIRNSAGALSRAAGAAAQLQGMQVTTDQVIIDATNVEFGNRVRANALNQNAIDTGQGQQFTHTIQDFTISIAGLGGQQLEEALTPLIKGLLRKAVRTLGFGTDGTPNVGNSSTLS